MNGCEDDTEFTARIGEAIRQYRTTLKISQEAFACSIQMHRAHYGALERGEKSPTVRTLQRITKGLGIKLSELIRAVEG